MTPRDQISYSSKIGLISIKFFESQSIKPDSSDMLSIDMGAYPIRFIDRVPVDRAPWMRHWCFQMCEELSGHSPRRCMSNRRELESRAYLSGRIDSPFSLHPTLLICGDVVSPLDGTLWKAKG